MSSLVVDGKKVHLLEVGDGPRTPVICLHSTGLGAFQWRRFARHAARLGHRVVAPDLLGYGESDPWPNEEVFHTENDDAVVTAIANQIDGPFHLVGHSYGGRLALRAALALRDRVVSVSVFEPVAYGVLRSMDDAEGLGDLQSTDHDGKFLDDDFGGTEAWMERFIDYWSGDGAWRDMGDAQKALFMRSARKVFEEVRETVHDPVPVEAYDVLTMPVMLMCGEHSRASGRRVCRLLADRLSDGRLFELPDGVHMSPLLHAPEVNDPILSLLSGLEG